MEARGLYTMGDIARHSLLDEDGLYAMFRKNAELLIDHAWGWEPCTIADIKAYKPASNSLSSGQVLQSAYDYTKARLVVRERSDALVLELVEKHLVTDQMELTVGYDVENHLVDEGDMRVEAPQQLDMFTDYEAERQRQEAEETALEKERRGQRAILGD